MSPAIRLAATALLLSACAEEPQFDLREATIADLQRSMEVGELSARDIAQYYLDEISRVDHAGPELRSIIELNPEALAIADRLDAERAAGNVRSPLHGIPVVLKANIDTGDRMFTTAGSLAMADYRAPDDAFLVTQLRDAGALVLGKTNLSEWANFRSSMSSSGWSSIGGQTKNPYDIRRNPCGSSSGSGVAVAANLTVLAIGTETDGSIVCPAGINGIVGIKPTIGMVSRDGIIPIAHSQDTAGPMARTVTDAALLLEVLAATDAGDASSAERSATIDGFADDLSADALRGKRIGILRNHYGAGQIPDVEAIVEQTIVMLQAAGAVVVDPLELATDGMGQAEGIVLNVEFKADLAKYFADGGAPYRTLQDIIDFNAANADTVMPIFGQEHMLESQASVSMEHEDYRQALADSKRISREAIDGAIRDQRLDAIMATTNSPAWLTDHTNGDSFSLSSSSYAAVSGYPSITVPAGFVRGLPVGVSFFAGAWHERELIQIAFAFEQASRVRKPPDNL